MKNSWRSAMRAYAALAVLRQAALCLAHYGFHCAHAYMCQVLLQEFNLASTCMLCQRLALPNIQLHRSQNLSSRCNGL